MAKINFNTLEKTDKERPSCHKMDHRSTYSVFELEGVKYFQIDMYGDASRKQPDTVSQSIQFTQDDIQMLVDILKQEKLV